MSTRYIFVTGGVVSSLGKGITAASLGRLLTARGLKVIMQKCDPYINVDPGTMNPYEHGEVFVTEDGAETDLDLGHYERFTDIPLSRTNSVSSGQIYLSVIQKERQGEYLGGTVQVVPHITNEIKSRILSAPEDTDVVITEIGGTVGDIESQPFLEAIRQLRWELADQQALYIHVTLVPYLESSGELKTKPTQHSVKELSGLGIQPDIVVCRCERPLPESHRKKIALHCNLKPQNVIQNCNASSLYEVPLILEKQGLGKLVCEELGLQTPEPDLSEWERIVDRHLNPDRSTTIAIAGKYIELRDAYLSVVEALTHGGIHHNARVKIKWIGTDDLSEEELLSALKEVDGILIPGGFGSRGMSGKMRAVQYARENKVPFLGICLGMQTAVVEFCRNVVGIKDADSLEMNEQTPHPVISLMEDQKGLVEKGGTMRLGKYDCHLIPGTKAHQSYQQDDISERHRHRYEFNNDYLEDITAHGMVVSGKNLQRDLVEIVELPEHPFFVGVQFHPEFKSRPNRPHPLFRDFVAAALAYHKESSR